MHGYNQNSSVYKMLSPQKPSQSQALTENKYRFRYGSKIIPHPDKIQKGGEDSCFFHENLLVIADGVGGFSRKGIDPALYSKRLCSLIGQSFVGPFQNQFIKHPQLLIQDAVRKNKEVGAATVSVITLDPLTGILRTAYLGDTVFSIFRENKEFFSAPEQQHSFNKPYQVGTTGNHPSQANRFEINTTQGDSIVFGTDGLWDNLPTQEIKFMLLQGGDCQSCIAKRIANASSRYSQTKGYSSPFYEKAKKAKVKVPKQGKKDDITVAVATIELCSS